MCTGWLARAQRRLHPCAEDGLQSKQFVEVFKKACGRALTHHAALYYDIALLIASGLKAVDGDLSRADELGAALQKVDFKSVWGNVAFDSNHHPIQDYYPNKIEADAKGNLMPKVLSKVLSQQPDAAPALHRQIDELNRCRSSVDWFEPVMLMPPNSWARASP